jgi:hypothetical protein
VQALLIRAVLEVVILRSRMSPMKNLRKIPKTKSPKKGKEEHMNKFWKWVRNKAPDGEDPDFAARTLF